MSDEFIIMCLQCALGHHNGCKGNPCKCGCHGHGRYKKKYTDDITQMTEDIVDWRKRKGFEVSWDNVAEKVLLVHTELSEATEALRIDDKENFGEELADAIIRLFDLMGSLDYDVYEIMRVKMLKNEDRVYKHGKLF